MSSSDDDNKKMVKVADIVIRKRVIEKGKLMLISKKK